MPASSVDTFFDANVLLYLASSDARKARRVETLLAGEGVISVQVLNEIANVARKKMQMSWEETRSLVGRLRLLLHVVPITLEIHGDGLRLAQRYRLSVYDGMIVAAALGAGCHTLFSEDMHHGQFVEGRLKILNPFLDA